MSTALALEIGPVMGAEPPPPPRPAAFEQALWDDILVRFANGETLRSICRAGDMPLKSTVDLWIIRSADLKREWEVAEGMHASALVDQAEDLGRGAVSAPQTRVKGIQVAVQALYKAAALRAPARYGDTAKSGAGVQVYINTTLDLPDSRGTGPTLDGTVGYQIALPSPEPEPEDA